jgi:Fuc2NAc and GlcNAc transferase
MVQAAPMSVAATILGPPLAVVAVIWLVNLYNFMDGSDGFAAGAGVAAAGSGALIAASIGAQDMMLLTTGLAGSTAGFLIWNWQPARIFMGDVGSYFLGFAICALCGLDIIEGRGPWLWLILLSPFITDATFTLGWRLTQRKHWSEAHRTHVYQRLILSGRTDAGVALALIVVTFALLAPMAWCAARWPAYGLIIASAVYAFTAIMWTFLHAKLKAYI